MADRKIDYFGTFLDSMQRASAQPADPANAVLKALRDGALPAKALIPLLGNSVSEFFRISEQLKEAGWVEKKDGDIFALTDKGREIAAVLG